MAMMHGSAPFQSAKMADYLISVGAVKINIENPYTWSSGWKSPIYCDNRVTLSYPEVRRYITEHLEALCDFQSMHHHGCF